MDYSEPVADPSDTPVDPIDDTEPWARDLLVERWRAMTPTEKLAVMSAHSIALQEMSIAGLRRRHPHDSEEDLELRAAVLRVGAEVVERVTGKRLSW